MSTGSGKDDAGQKRVRSPYTERGRETVTKGSGSRSTGSDAGYQTGATGKSSFIDSSREAASLERQKDEARLRELELRRRMEDIRTSNLGRAEYPSARQENSDRASLKTREEYLRELESRERDNLIRAQYSDEKRDPLGTTVRSDPGGSLEEHRDLHDLAEFKRLEPEPLYPQERIRYSRSRSETDLNAMSPAESQKYSSPMQPGRLFFRPLDKTLF